MGSHVPTTYETSMSAAGRLAELRWPRSRTFPVALCLALVLGFPSAAQATEIEDFERARRAYEQHDYRLAVDLFEQMVGGPTPAITNQLLVEESRKYLAAAYVFVGNRGAAEQQFTELLRARPDYNFNPAAFPAPVVAVYEAVRDRLAQERAEAEAERERLRIERAAERREAQLRLLALAEDGEVVIRHDPVLAWLPFGVGQLQNGNADLGVALLISQAATLLAAIGSIAIWAPLDDVHRSQGRLSTIDTGLLRGLMITNWASLGAFGVLAIAGIIEAHVSFVPSRTVRQPRAVPPELLERLDLTIGPTGVGLRVRF